MRRFSDYNIDVNTPQKSICDIIDMPIVVLSAVCVRTRYGDTEKVKLECSIGKDKFHIFTGSKFIRAQLEQIKKDQFPFQTIIRKKADGRCMMT